MHDIAVRHPIRMNLMPHDPDRPKFVVPWFVAWIDGKPDYRVIDEGKLEEAWRKKVCWVCGQRMGGTVSCVIGPMCAVTRTTSEPGCHIECAEYAVKLCPFMTHPAARRNTKDLPEDVHDAAGLPIDRNPGCSIIWTTRKLTPFRDGNGGVLFKLSDPYRISYWCEGRPATRDEVERSIDTGLPILRETCEMEATPYRVKLAHKELDKAIEVFQKYLPAEQAAVAPIVARIA